MRVLLVGSEVRSADYTASFWRGPRGITVVGAINDVNDAFQALQYEFLDAVIIDIDVDRLDGLDLCRFVHRTIPHTFATVCSSVDSLENRKIAQSCGCQYFLVKPLSRADIRDYVAAFRLWSQTQTGVSGPRVTGVSTLGRP